MAEKTDSPLELILQLCNAAAPHPWYPSAYAKAAGIVRDTLDPHLDKLRLAGVIQLTDWMHGTGQGYILTPAGKELLANPSSLALLRSGNLRLEAQAPPPLLDESATKLFARGDAVREVFMVQTPARMTYALIFLNLLVFAFGLQLAQKNGLSTEEYLGTANALGGGNLNPKLAAVYRAEGALQTLDLVAGQWWRLITSVFVHMGIIHLGGNMFSLYMVGPLSERMWGRGRYLALYLLAGFGGACAMAYYSPVNVIGAGASGAIWGLMTSLIAWLLLNREHMPRPFLNNLLRRLFNVILINVFISFMPGISMAAHFGGGAAGIAAAVLLHGNRHGIGLVRVLATIGLVLFPVACFAALYLGLKANPEWEAMEYQFKRLPRMAAAEADANKIIDSTLNPLLQRQFQGLSEKELREAIQAQQEVVKVLKRGENISREPPGYHDSKIENQRLAILQGFENRIAEVERASWSLVNPAARDETRLALRVFRQKVQPLLRLPPPARDKDSVEEAQTKLKEHIVKLTGMRELLEDLGPLESNQKLEDARKQEIENLTTYSDLFKAATTGLSEGAAWPEEKRKEYEQLEAKLKQ